MHLESCELFISSNKARVHPTVENINVDRKRQFHFTKGPRMLNSLYHGNIISTLSVNSPVVRKVHPFLSLLTPLSIQGV